MSKKQAGFTLLEMALASTIMITMAVIGMQESTLRDEQNHARILGAELLKFNNAVRDYVSYYAGSDSYQSLTGTRTGINWLKSANCGGGIPTSVNPNGFLSCGFLASSNQETTYGHLDFKTEITSPNVRTLDTTTVMSELKIAGKPRGDLAGLAAIVAGGASELNYSSTTRTTDGTARYCVSDAVSECVDHVGHILLFTSNDASNDTWLRTDGSNTMNQTIRFKPGNSEESRQISNISKLYNIDGEFLTLGNSTGNLPTFIDSGVVVDSDAEIMGALFTDKIVDRDDASYYIDPSDQSRFNSLSAESVSVSGDITAQGAVTAEKGITTPGQVKAGTIDSTGRIKTGELIQFSSTVMAGTSCESNGLMGVNAKGEPLSCQSGIWRASVGDQALVGGPDTYASCRRVYELDNKPIFCNVGEVPAGIYITTEGGGQAANLMCCH